MQAHSIHFPLPAKPEISALLLSLLCLAWWTVVFTAEVRGIEFVSRGGDSILEWGIEVGPGRPVPSWTRVHLKNISQELILLSSFQVIALENISQDTSGFLTAGIKIKPGESTNYTLVPQIPERLFQYDFHYAYLLGTDTTGIGSGTYHSSRTSYNPNEALLSQAPEERDSAGIRRLRKSIMTQKNLVLSRFEACTEVLLEAQKPHCASDEVLVEKRMNECDCFQKYTNSWVCQIRYIDHCQLRELADFRLVTGVIVVPSSQISKRSAACNWAQWQAKKNHCLSAQEKLLDSQVQSCLCDSEQGETYKKCYLPYRNNCVFQTTLNAVSIQGLSSQVMLQDFQAVPEIPVNETENSQTSENQQEEQTPPAE
ncbi:MAG: hypothetical protein HQM12_04960 [SAR324 cluster bacterium]|nr:hypothetical protein [SAR324 cluster bacterium]